jgi:hypothetical protein
MTIAIDPLEEFEFITEADLKLPVDDRTRWNLVGLDIRQRSRLEDETATGNIDHDNETVDSFRFNAGHVNYLALRAGLRGVENFRDRDGKPIEFGSEKGQLNVLGKNLRGVPTDAFLSRIPPGEAKEIGEGIRENLRLTPEEGKD